MLVEGVAVEYIVEIKVNADATDDSERVQRHPAQLVGQAVQEELTLGNVSEPFDLQSLKAQSSGIQHEIILLGNVHEPSGDGNGLHAEHFGTLVSPLHEQAIGVTDLRQGVVAVGGIQSQENLPRVVFVDGYVLFGGDIRLVSQVNKNVPRVFLRLTISTSVLVLEELYVRGKPFGSQP